MKHPCLVFMNSTIVGSENYKLAINGIINGNECCYCQFRPDFSYYQNKLFLAPQLRIWLCAADFLKEHSSKIGASIRLWSKRTARKLFRNCCINSLNSQPPFVQSAIQRFSVFINLLHAHAQRKTLRDWTDSLTAHCLFCLAWRILLSSLLS